ncbi:MAG: hypothetical protein HY370_09140 [Proteobacteria bacterium]|nr:hypothetical protein [Pseudomonadota bacterium]
MKKLSAADRIDRFLCGKQQHPFDFVNNPIFFSPRPDEKSDYTKFLRNKAKLDYTLSNITNKGLHHGIVIGSMSNGHEAYHVAEENREKIIESSKTWARVPGLTTQRLSHAVAPEILMSRIVLPYRQQNAFYTGLAANAKPEMAWIGVGAYEGVLRNTRESNAVMRGAKYQDYTFEDWWVPKVIDCSAMMLGGDWSYSRYGNAEAIVADMTQAGFLDHLRDHSGPGAAFSVVDASGRPVTLADRAWETAKHIVDVVERGFITDFAVAALVARFQLDDWLRDTSGKSPIDRGKAHPVLLNRSREDLARMDRLKEIMLPYIAAKCAHWMPYGEDKNLKSYFKAKVLPAAKDFDASAVQASKDELFAYLPDCGFINPDYYGPGKIQVPSSLQMAFQEAGAGEAYPRRRGTDGDYFRTKSAIFERNHFDRLPIWEQSFLTIAAGAHEVFDNPKALPRSFFIAIDPKGGTHARKYAEAKGLLFVKEAQAHGDPVDNRKNGFVAQVVDPRRKLAGEMRDLLGGDALFGADGAANIVTYVDFLDGYKDALRFADGIAAQGEKSNLSSRAKLEGPMDWMERNATGIVLLPDWPYSPKEVEFVMAAVKLKLGLTPRPFDGAKYRMDIYMFDPDAKGLESKLKEQSLHDLIATLGAVAEKWMDSKPPVPARDTCLVLAQLLELSDKMLDPMHRNAQHTVNPLTGVKSASEIVRWSEVNLMSPGFTRFRWTEPEKARDLMASAVGDGGRESMRDRLYRKLLIVAAAQFEEEDLEGLHPDYTDAWVCAHGLDSLEKERKTPGQTRYIDHRRPT